MTIKRITQEQFFDFIEIYNEDIQTHFGATYPSKDDYDCRITYGVYDEDTRMVGIFCLTVYMNNDNWADYGIHLSDCYIIPKARKKGFFTQVVQYTVDIANRLQYTVTATAVLNTSYPIFKKLGFVECESPSVKMKLEI